MEPQAGLATQQQAGPQGQGELEDLLVQIIQLLQQGATPDELVQQGVPAELVQQAVQMMQAQSQQTAPQEQVPMLGETEQSMGLAQ